MRLRRHPNETRPPATARATSRTSRELRAMTTMRPPTRRLLLQDPTGRLRAPPTRRSARSLTLRLASIHSRRRRFGLRPRRGRTSWELQRLVRRRRRLALKRARAGASASYPSLRLRRSSTSSSAGSRCSTRRSRSHLRSDSFEGRMTAFSGCRIMPRSRRLPMCHGTRPAHSRERRSVTGSRSSRQTASSGSFASTTRVGALSSRSGPSGRLEPRESSSRGPHHRRDDSHDRPRQGIGVHEDPRAAAGSQRFELLFAGGSVEEALGALLADLQTALDGCLATTSGGLYRLRLCVVARATNLVLSRVSQQQRRERGNRQRRGRSL
jgi:hypothetical protein